MRRLLGALWDALPAKRPVLERLRTVATPPESVYRHLHFKGVFTIPGTAPPIRLRSHGTVIENELFWRGLQGGWEGESLSLWKQLAGAADVVLDVGANSGIYALVAQAANPSATVVAFEPVGRVCERLRDNVALNGDHVRCVEAAVSDVTGTATLFEPPGSHPLSATLDSEIFGGEGQNEWKEVAVRSVRLDDYLTNAGLVPELIKVDVEGHELAVLEGFGDGLADAHPTILAEVLTIEHAEALAEMLGSLGYRTFQIDEADGPHGWEPGRAEFSPSNFLFCSSHIATRLGLAS